jgi:hypothetical protein
MSQRAKSRQGTSVQATWCGRSRHGVNEHGQRRGSGDRPRPFRLAFATSAPDDLNRSGRPEAIEKRRRPARLPGPNRAKDGPAVAFGEHTRGESCHGRRHTTVWFSCDTSRRRQYPRPDGSFSGWGGSGIGSSSSPTTVGSDSRGAVAECYSGRGSNNECPRPQSF